VNILAIYEKYAKDIAPFFPASANIDFLLMLLELKPSMRTRCVAEKDMQKSVVEWLKENGFYAWIDHENYIYISSIQSTLEKVIALDTSTEKQESKIGELFGYPRCCCKKIQGIGEEQIDAYEEAISQEIFPLFFKLIDPKNYRKGTAFISHVPCSTNCFDSLALAQQFGFFIHKNKHSLLFSGWVKELDKIYGALICH